MDKKLIKREVSLRFIAASQYLMHRYNIDSDSLFCSKIDIHPQVYSDIKKGKLNVGTETISKILSIFENISTDWIFSGKGDLIKYQTSKQRDAINKFYEVIKNDPQLNKSAVKDILIKITDELPDEGIQRKVDAVEESKPKYENGKKADGPLIPFVSVNAIGGFGNSEFSIAEQDVKDHYVIPKFKDRKIDFMIEVFGSSMYPKYSSGDVVACRTINESSFIQWNKVHVIATEEQGVLIKRLKKSKAKDCLLAVSDNKDYEPFDIPLSEINGIAIVVGVIRLE